MKTLLKTTDVFRVDTEDEAVRMINDFKDNALTGNYMPTKSGYILKTKKAKGEIVDSWCVVTLEKTFEQ